MLYDMPSDMLEVQNCTPVKIVFGQFCMNARTETMAFILLEQPVAYLGEEKIFNARSRSL
jgi:hypothetical protein